MQEFLNELAVLSARSVSSNKGSVLCGITLLRHRRAATVAYNSETAKAMDELQYAFREGPCLTAALEQQTIVVNDFETDGRWPEYAEAVAAHGLRSTLSAPFTIGPGAQAAMNLYSYRRNSFTDEEIAFAESYARQASKGLQLALRMARLQRGSRQPQPRHGIANRHRRGCWHCHGPEPVLPGCGVRNPAARLEHT